MNDPNRNTRRLAHLLLALALLPACAVLAQESAPEPPPQRHMLWHVEGRGGEGWLVGSLHFGTPELYPLAPPFGRAWNESGELLVELDITDVSPAEMQRIVTREGVYPNETRLEEHVPADTWQRAREAAARYGLPLVLLQQQRPWLASVTLTTLELQRGGWREDLGIDLHFLLRAREGRDIVELETFEQQIRLFAGFTDAEQVAMLESTLDELYGGEDAFAQMLAAWRDGDTRAMDTLINQSILQTPGGERVHEVLIVRRNHAMAARFAERLAAGARPLMVVGAGHLVGEQGIPNLLRARGIDVTQVVTRAAQAAAAE